MTNQTLVEGLPDSHALAARVLVLFTAVLLVVMPWTEYFWHFDGFLRGGQDLEFGLLSLASVFCLVLLLSKQGKVKVDLIFSVLRRMLFAPVYSRKTVPAILRRWMGTAFIALVPSPVLKIYNLPIQI